MAGNYPPSDSRKCQTFVLKKRQLVAVVGFGNKSGPPPRGKGRFVMYRVILERSLPTKIPDMSELPIHFGNCTVTTLALFISVKSQ